MSPLSDFSPFDPDLSPLGWLDKDLAHEPPTGGVSAALDDNGEGFTLLTQATLAVVLAATLATTARASTVSYWQEELAPQAAAVGLDELYQLDAPLLRRAVCLAPDPDTPEITPHLDEVYEYPVVAPQRPAALLGDAPSHEVLVPQPLAFGLDEIYWQAPETVPTRVRGELVYDTPELVPLAASLSIDELYWQDPVGAVATPARMPAPPDTPEIVPVAPAISIDELYWIDPVGRVASPVRMPPAPDTLEIVPQPPVVPLWENTWEPAFVCPAVRWTQVSQTQEAIVPTLPLAEYWPAPEMLVRARPVVAFQAPPDDPVAVPVVDVSGRILRGVLRLEPVFLAAIALDETLTAGVALSIPLSGQLALGETLAADAAIDPALNATLAIQPPE